MDNRIIAGNVQECRGGRVGFYYYLTLKQTATDSPSNFFRFLTRTTGKESIDGPLDAQLSKVIYIPDEYCVHPSGEMVEIGKRQFRISYGFEELPQIHATLKLMKSAIVYSSKNP